MMGRLAKGVLLLISLWFWRGPFWCFPSEAGETSETNPVEVEIFTRVGCPRCQAAHRFLVKLQQERPHLRIIAHEVERDRDALTRLRTLMAEHGGVVGVPTFLLRGRLSVGYHSSATTEHRLKALLDAPLGLPPLQEDNTSHNCAPELTTPCEAEPLTFLITDETIEVPLLGHVRVHAVGLPLFTIVIGLLDGFNPCAMGCSSFSCRCW